MNIFVGVKKHFFSKEHVLLLIGCAGLIVGTFFVGQVIQFHLLLKKTATIIKQEHDQQNELFTEKINPFFQDITTIPNLLAPALKNPQSQLLAPILASIFKENPSICTLTIANPSQQHLATAWGLSKTGFVEKLEHSAFSNPAHTTGWSAPYSDPATNKKMVAFGANIPASNELVLITLDLQQLKKEIDETKSSYLAHVLIKDTLGNIVLDERKETISKSYVLSIRNKTVQQQKIPAINWMLETAYYPNNVPIGAMRSLLMLIITSFTLLMCLCIAFAYTSSFMPFKRALDIICGLLFIGNCILWLTVYYLPLDPVDNIVRINDPIHCKQFITQQKKDAAAINCQFPSISEVGMLVQGIDLNQENNAQVDILLWQHTQDLKNTPGLTLMHNEGEKGVEVFHNNPNDTTRMWLFNTKVTDLDDETYYPLHTCYVTLEVVPTNLDEPIILIPDASMQMLPNNPWISKRLQTPGYRLEDSFITTEERDDAAIKKLTHPLSNKLIFHFIFREALIGALLNYILPFLIALISVFGLLWFGEYPQDRFAGYIATCFITVMLQGSLRSARKIITISYLDFFFVYAYLAILLCMAAAILIIKNPKKYASLDIILQHAYWPIQFFLWLITTTMLFC